METKKKLPLTRILIGLACSFFLLGIAGFVVFLNYNVPVMAGAQMDSGVKIEARSYGLLSGGVDLSTMDGVNVSIGGKQIDIQGNSISVGDQSIATIDAGTAQLEIVHRNGTIEFTADGKSIASLPIR